MFDFSESSVAQLAAADVTRALLEDVGAGDLTAALVDAQRSVHARVIARQPAVICGRAWADAAIFQRSPS